MTKHQRLDSQILKNFNEAPCRYHALILSALKLVSEKQGFLAALRFSDVQDLIFPKWYRRKHVRLSTCTEMCLDNNLEAILNSGKKIFFRAQSLWPWSPELLTVVDVE